MGRGPAWTLDDHRLFVELLNRGVRHKTIADVFGRTEQAINSRAMYFRQGRLDDMEPQATGSRVKASPTVRALELSEPGGAIVVYSAPPPLVVVSGDPKESVEDLLARVADFAPPGVSFVVESASEMRSGAIYCAMYRARSRGEVCEVLEVEPDLIVGTRPARAHGTPLVARKLAVFRAVEGEVAFR